MRAALRFWNYAVAEERELNALRDLKALLAGNPRKGLKKVLAREQLLKQQLLLFRNQELLQAPECDVIALPNDGRVDNKPQHAQ